MKSTIIFCILSVFPLGATQAFAQSPESFFPYHVGDIWQYTLDNTNIIYQTDIIVTDSTDSAGTVYLKYNGDNFYRYYVDTSYNVYASLDGGLSYSYFYYKLDADSGDSWIFWYDTEDYYIRAKVVDIFQDNFWGISSTVKEIEEWLFFGQDSLQGATRFLASGFGLVAYWGEPGPFYHLTGAIVDSVRYGFIIGIEEKKNHSTLPKEVELYQNYPNPFNSITTIQYDLPVSAKVELNVYNLVGRKVKTLVNTIHMAGTYRVPFDASQLSSGVYFYRLKINDEDVFAKKMVLLK